MPSPLLLRSLERAHGMHRLMVLKSSNTRLGRRWTASSTSVRSDLSNLAANPPRQVEEGWMFVDSVFPVQLGTWDLRRYIAASRKENLMGRLASILDGTQTHGFQVLNLEQRTKDGGVFVHFQYSPGNTPTPEALSEIEMALHEQANKQGGFPTWLGIGQGRLWRVVGKPWREDMHRFASPILKVAFEGPDVHPETLYNILRPFGKILDLTQPGPVPAGTLRFSNVTFSSIRSAAAAHNCAHGTKVPVNGQMTRISTGYERPIKAHAVRDWMSSHPRIVIPVVVFLLGTFTYMIFDPIRIFSVEAKVMNWFDYRNFAIVKWLRQNTLDRLSFGNQPKDLPAPSDDTFGTWKDREEAENALRVYLSDTQSTVAFVYGPQGSGKSSMTSKVLKQAQRRSLVIDCDQLNAAKTDSDMVSKLAGQTDYWPIFTFLASANNLIDLASVGLIGQKAGLSASMETQLKEILEVVGTALIHVKTNHHHQEQRLREAKARESEHAVQTALRRERIERGLWHDGRIDCIAGNGVMSELGFGDEILREEDSDLEPQDPFIAAPGPVMPKPGANGVDQNDIMATPVVVIKNFSSKGSRGDVLLNVLADWAAALVDGQIAHVVVISDNRENNKALAKALSTKPLAYINLSDADTQSSLMFIKTKLEQAGLDGSLTKEQQVSVGRLGGRASDLETLVHKVKGGQRLEDAVEDIIIRAASELRKNAFGDDAEDAKSLLWAREQAWTILTQLSKKDEIKYYDVLMDFPFKGDETALRAMEHAELISITTHEGRPATIRPGRPVYRFVFERLVNDAIFNALQQLNWNEKAIAASESTIQKCEQELIGLKDIQSNVWGWIPNRRAPSDRAAFLLKKMREAETKVQAWDAKNRELKLVLKRG